MCIQMKCGKDFLEAQIDEKIRKVVSNVKMGKIQEDSIYITFYQNQGRLN